MYKNIFHYFAMKYKLLGYDVFEDSQRNYLEFDIEFPDIFKGRYRQWMKYNVSDLNPEEDDRLVGLRPDKTVRVKIFMEIVFTHSRKYLNWRSVFYFSGSICDKNNVETNTFANRQKMRLRDPKKFLEEVLNKIKPPQLVTYFDTVLIWWYRTRMKNY